MRISSTRKRRHTKFPKGQLVYGEVGHGHLASGVNGGSCSGSSGDCCPLLVVLQQSKDTQIPGEENEGERS